MSSPSPGKLISAISASAVQSDFSKVSHAQKQTKCVFHVPFSVCVCVYYVFCQSRFPSFFVAGRQSAESRAMQRCFLRKLSSRPDELIFPATLKFQVLGILRLPLYNTGAGVVPLSQSKIGKVSSCTSMFQHEMKV